MRDSPSTDEDFTAFVAARSPALYRSAWLLTTNAPAAEDLVQSALAKASELRDLLARTMSRTTAPTTG